MEEFGLGFPPRLVTLFEAGGTRFTLNLIPLGGFVKPAGEDDPQVEGGLAGAKRLTRAAVLIAGPMASLSSRRRRSTARNRPPRGCAAS